MNFYNTGNPVPSNDPRDLDDNAKNLDLALNSGESSFVDRKGVERKTINGYGDAFSAFLSLQGWSTLGVYAAGISIISHSQAVEYQGQPYALKPSVPASIEAPYVTTGNWATEGANFKLVGDNSLRQELLSDQGSQNIGTPRGTVEADVLSLREKNDIQDGNLAAAVTDLTRIAETGVFGSDVMFSRVRAKTQLGAPLMHVLGDSISHGAFADDWYRNGWVNIFKRMLNVEFGTSSYGVTPILPFPNTVTGAMNTDVHDVQIGAGWVIDRTLKDVPSGASWIASAEGAAITLTVPTFQHSCQVYYATGVNMGTFEIRVNGNLVETVNASASSRDAFRNVGVLLIDDGFGTCKIEIVKTGTLTVEITGIGYQAQGNQSVLQNLSQSGRLLRNTSEGMVQRLMSQSALFVMALGLNDYYDHRNDDGKFEEFVQVIDWLIQYANQYEVPIVVPDFVWYVGAENRTRAQLKRLATETSGSYIPFPDYFKRSGGAPDAAYLMSTLNLFTDDLHPNIAGHKYIAEVIAKKLGLSVTSKQQVLDYHDWWYPLQLNRALGATNAATSSSLVSAVRNQGGEILVRINVTGLPTGGGGIAFGYPSRAGVRFDLPVIIPLPPTSAGISRGVCAFNDAGISISPNSSNDTDTYKLYFSVPRTS